MIIKIAVGVALGILLIGIVILVLLTIWILWTRWMEKLSERTKEDYDDEDYYTEEDFDLPEIDKDIQAKQMEQEVKERIQDWFAENDIEMQEEE